MKLLEKDWFKKEDNKMDNATKAISSLLCAAMHKNKSTMEVFDEEYETFKSTDILLSSLTLTITYSFAIHLFICTVTLTTSNFIYLVCHYI